MKTRTLTQRFVMALAMMLALAIVPSMAFAQNKTDNQSNVSSTDEEGNALVGVWQQIAVPAFVDCQTGAPGSIINVAYTFNQGGTMYEEDTLSLDRYRTTGGGIWKRTSGRNYTYLNLHYAFDPAGTFQLTIKQRSNLTLSRDGNSFTENGTFEGIEPGGNVIFAGCFAATAHRLTF
ncbi:MAG: hypothetical protein M3R69_12795 [Acidobacteriota bacterium]|nr:hypothetical protein [Acidobacteriota bacterium]